MAVGFNSALFRYARTLVRGAAERPKPSDERLREFRDTALPLVERRLLADVPVYPDVEEISLSLGLMRMRELLGPDHPVVTQLMRTSSPEALARDLVTQDAPRRTPPIAGSCGRAVPPPSRRPTTR